VYFRDADGQLTSLPTEWTSLAQPDPFVTASDGRSALRVADLIDLLSLVARLRA
jgi:hypothetical protein